MSTTYAQNIATLADGCEKCGHSSFYRAGEFASADVDDNRAVCADCGHIHPNNRLQGPVYGGLRRQQAQAASRAGRALIAMGAVLQLAPITAPYEYRPDRPDFYANALLVERGQSPAFSVCPVCGCESDRSGNAVCTVCVAHDDRDRFDER